MAKKAKSKTKKSKKAKAKKTKKTKKTAVARKKKRAQRRRARKKPAAKKAKAKPKAKAKAKPQSQGQAEGGGSQARPQADGASCAQADGASCAQADGGASPQADGAFRAQAHGGTSPQPAPPPPLRGRQPAAADGSAPEHACGQHARRRRHIRKARWAVVRLRPAARPVAAMAVTAATAARSRASFRNRRGPAPYARDLLRPRVFRFGLIRFADGSGGRRLAIFSRIQRRCSGLTGPLRAASSKPSIAWSQGVAHRPARH